MNKGNLSRIMVIVMIACLTSMLLAGACAKPAPAPTTPPTPAPVASPTPKPAPAPSTAPKESAAEFYKNNAVTLVVPYAAGGGNDVEARQWAAFWPDITGGSITVKNVTGGGGIKGINDVWDAKLDGLTIGMSVYSGIALNHIFKEPGMKFDMAKFNWMGWIGRHGYVAALGVKSPYETATDLKKAKGKGLKAPGSGGIMQVASAMVWYLWDLQDARVVLGFAGGPERALALGRGEMDMMTINAVDLGQWIDKAMVKPPFVTLESKRSKVWPNTPAVPEVIEMTPEKQKFWAIYESLSMSMAFFAPPGLPKERIDFLRDTFSKIVAYKPYVDNATKRLGSELLLPPATAKEVTEATAKLTVMSEADLANFVKLVDSYTAK